MTEIHLVETSMYMRSLQAKNINFPNDRLHWYDSIEDIPTAAGKSAMCSILLRGRFRLVSDNEFTMVIAHEFFDALPINILQEGRYSTTR